MAAAAAAGESGCSRSAEPESSPGTGRQLLTEVTRAWGVPADAAPWPDGTYRIPEITCAGVALLDVEGDGDLDIYLVCHPPPGNTQAPAPNRLFVQEATGRFVEAPGARGLADPGHGNGAAVGDLDSDGDIDVYVCNFERDALYVGRGDGFFEGRTRQQAASSRTDGAPGQRSSTMTATATSTSTSPTTSSTTHRACAGQR
jgi:hypothetical protein